MYQRGEVLEQMTETHMGVKEVQRVTSSVVHIKEIQQKVEDQGG